MALFEIVINIIIIIDILLYMIIIYIRDYLLMANLILLKNKYK